MGQSFFPAPLVFTSRWVWVEEWGVFLGNGIVEIGLEDSGARLIRSVVWVPFRAKGDDLVGDFLLVGRCREAYDASAEGQRRKVVGNTAELQSLELRMCHCVTKITHGYCLRVENGARHLLLLLLLLRILVLVLILILILVLVLVLRGRSKHAAVLRWLLGAEYARCRRVEERGPSRRGILLAKKATSRRLSSKACRVVVRRSSIAE